jgi:hypothetical protein
LYRSGQLRRVVWSPPGINSRPTAVILHHIEAVEMEFAQTLRLAGNDPY